MDCFWEGAATPWSPRLGLSASRHTPWSPGVDPLPKRGSSSLESWGECPLFSPHSSSPLPGGPGKRTGPWPKHPRQTPRSPRRECSVSSSRSRESWVGTALQPGSSSLESWRGLVCTSTPHWSPGVDSSAAAAAAAGSLESWLFGACSAQSSSSLESWWWTAFAPAAAPPGSPGVESPLQQQQSSSSSLGVRAWTALQQQQGPPGVFPAWTIPAASSSSLESWPWTCFWPQSSTPWSPGVDCSAPQPRQLPGVPGVDCSAAESSSWSPAWTALQQQQLPGVPGGDCSAGQQQLPGVLALGLLCSSSSSPGVLAWTALQQLPGVLGWAAQPQSSQQLPGVLAWTALAAPAAPWSPGVDCSAAAAAPWSPGVDCLLQQQQLPGVLGWTALQPSSSPPGVLAWTALAAAPLESWHGRSSSEVLPQNPRAGASERRQRRSSSGAWRMRAYLPQPSRRLAGKPPPRKPKRRKVLRADVSCGARRARASLLDQSAQPGAQAENGAEPLHVPSAPAAEEGGQNLQRAGGRFSSLLHLLLDPSVPGALLPTVREFHCWRIHSVMVCATEEPRTQTSRQHDGS
ncbi:hypothetical protein CRENBAI_014157 [Crenichthys baileyi]|uniref:Uncharacterized protein n=1 Tax=Crenichthys baileyi TaxID=28760 RepID=A0AAV9RUI4_9TELE